PTAAERARAADPAADVMARIKERLSLNDAARRQRDQERPPVYVPAQLDQVMQGVQQAIEELGVEVTGMHDIQYGKKVTMRCELRQAEVNIFFGKRGFSVVASPKRGTSQELNELMSRAVEDYLDSLTR
ncbi:MAG: virulence protein E, partial [Muribaculaceae bacterium]|nr:virulence protein E [Muribaculaceae bacterium]